MQVKNDARVYSGMETLIKGVSNKAKAASSSIGKAGSYINENIKPKLELKETPNFASGFAAPLGITGVQAVKNLAAKKGVLPLITTAKAFNMSAASIPTDVVTLKAPINAVATPTSTPPVSTPASSSVQGGIPWDNIASFGAGALGLAGAAALTKAAKAAINRTKRINALLKADDQIQRERNSARLRVLEDSGLAEPSDRKRALALPVETGEFSALETVTKLGKSVMNGASNLFKGNSASIKGLEGLAKSASAARDSLFSGKSQTYNTADKILSKINIGNIGKNATNKIVNSQSQSLEKGGGAVADFFDKKAERGMNKVNSLTEQLNKATSSTEKSRLNDMISRETSKIEKSLNRKETVSDVTKAASDFMKNNSKTVLGVESAVKSVAKTQQMNARARADEAEAQRLNAQSR